MREQLAVVIAQMLEAGIGLDEAWLLFADAYVGAALQRSGSNITATASVLGLHRNSIHNYIRDRPAIKAAMGRKHRRTRVRPRPCKEKTE